MITAEQIRAKLIDAIKYSGLTQTEIAKRVGVCQQAIGKYLHENKFPSLETFANLCAALELDANDILCLR